MRRLCFREKCLVSVTFFAGSVLPASGFVTLPWFLLRFPAWFSLQGSGSRSDPANADTSTLAHHDQLEPAGL